MEQLIINGKVYYNITDRYVDMGRKKHTRLIIKDIKVEDGKCIISVEIRRGGNCWKKAYGFSSDYLENWDMEAFKERIRQDALKLEEDKRFEERVLMRIEQMKEQEILLD